MRDTLAWIIAAATAVGVLVILPTPIWACSYMYTGPFTEVARDLTVAVVFDGKPLPGASVELWSPETSTDLSKSTAADGTTRFTGVQPGKYIVFVRHLEVFAVGSEHIEVLPRVTALAKGKLEYRWGEKPFEVRQAAGRVMTADQGDLLKQVMHSVGGQFPVDGAHIELRHPTNGKVYKARSATSGEFALGGVPNGTYVLRISSGVGPGTFLVRVTPGAKKDSLFPVFGRSNLCGSGFELVP